LEGVRPPYPVHSQDSFMVSINRKTVSLVSKSPEKQRQVC
jgi:hypothetical protein